MCKGTFEAALHLGDPSHLTVPRPDLVCVGSRGQKMLKRLILGSVSSAVLSQAAVPVCVYRSNLAGHSPSHRPQRHPPQPMNMIQVYSTWSCLNQVLCEEPRVFCESLLTELTNPIYVCQTDNHGARTGKPRSCDFCCGLYYSTLPFIYRQCRRCVSHVFSRRVKECGPNDFLKILSVSVCGAGPGARRAGWAPRRRSSAPSASPSAAPTPVTPSPSG